jgi:hypothetical protein
MERPPGVSVVCHIVDVGSLEWFAAYSLSMKANVSGPPVSFILMLVTS